MNTSLVEVEGSTWAYPHVAPMQMALVICVGLSIYGALAGDFKHCSAFLVGPTFSTGVAAVLAIYTLHFLFTEVSLFATRLLEIEFASMKKVRFTADLTVQPYARRLVQAAPADALAILQKAINYSLIGQFARPVGVCEVERAMVAMRSPLANRATQRHAKKADWDV